MIDHVFDACRESINWSSVPCKSNRRKQLSGNADSGRSVQDRPEGRLTRKSQRTTVMIRTSSFRAVILTTVAFGALSRAPKSPIRRLSQTNLVSDIPGLATITDPNLRTLGAFRSRTGVHLGFEPGQQTGHAFRGDRQHRRLRTGSLSISPRRQGIPRSDRPGRQRNGDGLRRLERGEWQIRCVHLCQSERLDRCWNGAATSVTRTSSRAPPSPGSPSTRPTLNSMPPTAPAPAASTCSTIRSTR